MLHASPVGAATGTDQAVEEPGRAVSFVALACDSFSRVPASIRVAPTLDETGGGYLSWGPAAGGVVADPTAVELAGCRPVDGVQFRLSAVSNGAALATSSPTRVGAGAEDGELTTRSRSTGESGPGRLGVAADELTPAQQRAIGDESAAGGLWVSADGLPGSFAGLRCHRDQSNGDNLEVLRVGKVDGDVFCVAYAVESIPLAAVPPPAAPVAVPLPPSSPVVPVAVLPALPPAPAAPLAPVVAETPPVAVLPPVLPPAAVVETTPLLATPAPVAALPPPALPAVSPATIIGLVPSTPPRKVVPSPEEEVALGPASAPMMEIVVEVGGVTRGARSVKVASARTPWIRPVEVDLRCPGERPRILDVEVGSVPGAQVSVGPLPMGRGEDACLIGLAEDGVDGTAGLVRVQWGDKVLSEGQYTRIEPEGAGTQTLRVQVTYGSAAESAESEAALGPAIDDSPKRLPPAVSVSLAGLAIGGLVAAASLSWRGRRTA